MLLIPFLWSCSQLVTHPAGMAQTSPTQRFDILNNGRQPAHDISPVCVRDKRTGLIWEVKSSQPGLQYRHNTYTWYATESDNNGGFAGYQNGGDCTGSRCDTAGYIEALNRLKLCGLTHWRLPSRTELDSLVDYRIRYPGPMVDLRRFPNTVAQYYWAATPDAYDRDRAWGIGFSYGFDYTYPKMDTARVRLVHDAIATSLPHKGLPPVVGPAAAASPAPPAKQETQQCHPDIRATTPASRFIVADEGTLIDRRSGLMWMRCSLGQKWQNNRCTGKPQRYTLAQARRLAATTRFAGHTDWRLPGITMLSTLTELRCSDPAVNLSLFPDTNSVAVWTGTVFVSDPKRQWQVEFHHGENLADQGRNPATVRLVRRITLPKPVPVHR